MGGLRKVALPALGTLVVLAGCGSSESSTTTPTSPAKAAAAVANGETGPVAQRRAEAIFQHHGMSYYIGELRPSSVRFRHPCREAKASEEGNAATVPGRWDCAGMGLITINGGSGSPGECMFVEGDVTAHGLVGKPSGEPESYSGSPCQLNVILGVPGTKPSPHLVASWEASQRAEAAHVHEMESTPEAQQQKREEAKEEHEEAERTAEAERAGRGE